MSYFAIRGPLGPKETWYKAVDASFTEDLMDATLYTLDEMKAAETLPEGGREWGFVPFAKVFEYNLRRGVVECPFCCSDSVGSSEDVMRVWGTCSLEDGQLLFHHSSDRIEWDSCHDQVMFCSECGQEWPLPDFPIDYD